MKLSVVISTQPASFSAMAYQGHLEETIEKIKNLGYDGVELAVRDPQILPLTDLVQIIEKSNLSVPALGTGQAFGEEGLSFTHQDSKIRRLAIDRIISHMQLAEHFGALVIIGLIRGKDVADIGLKQAEDWFAEALVACAQSNPSVKLAVEPINRYESDLINTVDAGLRFLDRLKLSNIGLLLDSFHMNIEEPSIFDSIASAGDRLFHFHIADSNRWYPGAGHIDFDRIIEQLDKASYSGFLSAEILPKPDPDTAAEKTIAFMKKRIP